MWHEEFDGLPAEEFLVKLDPLLAGLKDRLFRDTHACDVKVGNLSEEWAEKLGLSTNVAIGAGAFDAHLGAVGGQIEIVELLLEKGADPNKKDEEDNTPIHFTCKSGFMDILTYLLG